MNTQINPDGAALVLDYDTILHPVAQKNQSTFGRRITQEADPYRLPFQRDRDRIIHSTSFRRLRGKMQVVSPQGRDHYRNRLTHTIEVSQIARDLARQFRLNEDLAECIALGHDLGHPPFGHAGEVALDQKMRAFGKNFEHNNQSLRIVEVLEKRYPEFSGLNLSYEVISGLQKHLNNFTRPDGSVTVWSTLESQLVDICDEMAYVSADLEDAFRGGYIDLDMAGDNSICAEVIRQLHAKYERQEFTFKVVTPSNINHQMLYFLNKKLVQAVEQNILPFSSQFEAINHPNPLIIFDSVFYEEFLILKQFLSDHYYKSNEVEAQTLLGSRIISTIFDYLLLHPHKIPSDFLPYDPLENRICDYIAGMTDEYCMHFMN